MTPSATGPKINDANNQMNAIDAKTIELVEYIAALPPNTESDTVGRAHIKSLLQDGADGGVTFTADMAQPYGLSRDATLLHLAARRGNWPCMQTLMQEAHASWNSVDAGGTSAGQVARDAGFDGIYERLIDEGVRAEFLLAALGQRVVEDGTLLVVNDKNAHTDEDEGHTGGDADGDLVQETSAEMTTTGAAAKGTDVVANSEYLSRRLVFSQGRLLDSDGNAVMMGWESPLMVLHAEKIAPVAGLDILNVGFGLGIIDELIQKRSPRTHTIIEAHPDVYAKMIADGWDRRPGVRILFGRWQDVIPSLTTYDGIFFDTFGEYYDDLRDFHQILPNILTESGVYSFFNGLAGTNPFFHDVACKMAELDLVDIGFRVEFEDVAVDELADDVWRDTKRAYWNLPIYRVPIVRFDL